MGNDISTQNSINYYQNELFNNENKREKIPIFQLEKIKLMENHDIEENSIIFLYTLDFDRDGYISKEDISKLIHLLHKESLDPNDCDFGFKCGAFFTKKLCNDIIEKSNEYVKTWVLTSISTSFQVTQINENKFIDGDAIKKLYDLLQIQSLLGRTFQWVLDMLQRHAEANLKMNLNDPTFDDLVPIDTILFLVTQIFNGMSESFLAMTKH